MKNFGKIISDKDIITKEYLDSKGYISAITSKMVTDALGFTPFDSAAFTKASIKNALGIADWALAASKPSYDDVYLKLTGGTITGNLTVNGKVSASGLSISTATASFTFTDNIIYSNASLRIYGGWSLRLGANGTGIQEWTDLKTILGLGSLAYKNSIEASDISSIAWSKITGKPTTLSGYGITDAVIWSNNIDVSANASFKHIGYANSGNGWASVGGPAMAFGSDKTQYVKLVFPNYNEYYQQRIYYKHIKGGVEATSWGEILTKDNFSAYGLALKTDSSSWSPTDAGAFVGYTTGINGWATAGIAAALAYANYTGLLNFAGGTDGNVGLYVSNSHNGVMRAWEKVLTDKTLAKFASSNDLTAEGKWKIDITGMADKFGVEYTGNLDTNSRNGLAHYNTRTTGRPSNYGMVMQMANVSNPVPGTAEHWITQIASSTYNDLYYRIRINTGAWQGWRKILTDGNIGTTSLPSLNLNGETITSWDDVRHGWSYRIIASWSADINVGRYEHVGIGVTLTSSSPSVTFNINNIAPVSSVVVFRTGATLPTVKFKFGGTEGAILWEDGIDITQNLSVNTSYRIEFDGNFAMVRKFN